MGTSEILTSLTMANHRTGEKQKTQITKYAGAFFFGFFKTSAAIAIFFFIRSSKPASRDGPRISIY